MERVVPPPVGFLAGRATIGRHGRGWTGGRTGQGPGIQWVAIAVGDDEVVGGAGDGDDAPVMQAVMVGAEQDQVCYKFLNYPHRGRERHCCHASAGRTRIAAGGGLRASAAWEKIWVLLTFVWVVGW